MRSGSAGQSAGYPARMLCRTRYRCQILCRNVVTAEVVAVFEEGREPDEWGDPGRLVYRKLAMIDGVAGTAQLSHAASPHYPSRTARQDIA